ALDLAANHPGRVLGTVLIGPSVTSRTPAGEAPPPMRPSRVPMLGEDPASDWAKYNRGYWQDDYDDFLWFFLRQCFPERHSTKQIEDGVAWGRETDAKVLLADAAVPWPDLDTLRTWCGRIHSPVLILHGDDDRVSPLRRGELLAELTGGELVVLPGS